MRQGPLVSGSPGLGLKHRPAATAEKPTIRTFLSRNLSAIVLRNSLFARGEIFYCAIESQSKAGIVKIQQAYGVALVMELILLSQRPLRRKILVTHRPMSSRPLSYIQDCKTEGLMILNRFYTSHRHTNGCERRLNPHRSYVTRTLQCINCDSGNRAAMQCIRDVIRSAVM